MGISYTKVIQAGRMSLGTLASAAAVERNEALAIHWCRLPFELCYLPHLWGKWDVSV